MFNWQDITKSADRLNEEGITLVEGLKLLHAKEDNGKIHVGVDAFILIWKQLKRWRILAVLISLPVVRQSANLVYRMFASWRFKRLAHCHLAEKNEVKP